MARPKLARIDDVVLDVCVSSKPRREVEATDHPVERGANVSDHARLKPVVLEVAGYVTNAPLSEQGSTTPGEDRAGAAMDRLVAILEATTPVTVVTERETLHDMLMVSVEFPRDKDVGDGLAFTASFKKIRFAEVRRQFIKVRKEPREAKKPTGKQPTDAVDESILHSLHNDKGHSAIVDKLSPKRGSSTAKAFN